MFTLAGVAAAAARAQARPQETLRAGIPPTAMSARGSGPTVLLISEGCRTIEFALTLEALGRPVEIAGREKKGYGGLGIRFAPRQETVILTDAGVEPGDSGLVVHRWAELSALFAGRAAGAALSFHAGSDIVNPRMRGHSYGIRSLSSQHSPRGGAPPVHRPRCLTGSPETGGKDGVS